MSDFGRLQELARAAGVQVSAPSVVDVPYASGTGEVGSTLNCTMGNWTAEPTAYSYQWLREGNFEAGTGADYTVVAADAGQNLSCVVTATNSAGSTVAPPSNAIAVAAAAVRRPGPSHDVPTPVHDAHAEARREAASETRQRK